MYGNDLLLVGSAGPSFTTSSLGANDPKVGDRVIFGEDEYLFVHNAGGTDLAPSYGATLSAVSGYSVTISSTTSVDLLVGVCKHATIAAGAYGWLLTRGFTQVEMGANNSAAVGALLVLGTDGTFASKTTGVGFTAPAVVKLMEVAASGASATAYVRL